MEGKVLVRKTKDGKIYNWEVEQDDTLCTLQEAFLKVEPSLGFNIELKFDDHIVYEQAYLTHVLQAILKVQKIAICSTIFDETVIIMFGICKFLTW